MTKLVDGVKRGRPTNKQKSSRKNKLITDPEVRARAIEVKKNNLIDETIKAILWAEGSTKKACAILGIQKQSYYKRLQKYPEIKRAIDIIPETARDLLKSSSITAVENIKRLQLSNNENISLQASKEILDRSGVIAPNSDTNVQVNVFNKLKEDIDSFDI